MADPGVPTPAALRPPAPATASDPAPSAASDPTRFGRVEADGTVILLAPEGEVTVGQWAAGDPSEGLAFFGRKYDDLVVEIDLIEKRLADHRATAEQAEAVVTRVREALAARSFVGDIVGLEARCDRLTAEVEAAKQAARARKAEQREAALVTRRALADEAESLRDSTSWKATTERYAAIVEEWKALPRGDRGAEQELWQRISAARTAFDKRRRAHFSELDGQRKDALGRKRDLIAKAEALSTSTDWARTSKQLRDLMAEWKTAPRASRTDEDKLWKRFKAAQDAFYAARTAAEEAEQETLRTNVPAKEALVVEAEGLLPVARPQGRQVGPAVDPGPLGPRRRPAPRGPRAARGPAEEGRGGRPRDRGRGVEGVQRGRGHRRLHRGARPAPGQARRGRGPRRRRGGRGAGRSRSPRPRR